MAKQLKYRAVFNAEYAGGAWEFVSSLHSYSNNLAKLKTKIAKWYEDYKYRNDKGDNCPWFIARIDEDKIVEIIDPQINNNYETFLKKSNMKKSSGLVVWLNQA